MNNFSIKNPIWTYGPLLFVLGLTIIIYLPGLDGPLILDDLPHLKPMLRISDGELSWIEYMQQNGFGWRVRPVSILSFVANFSITGSDIWYLKAVNLFIHLFCGVLIYILSLLLLTLPVTGVSEKACRWLALWVAAAWLLTPIQVSTVLYVIQRMAQLSTLFLLAALVCYVYGRTKLSVQKKQAYIFIVLAFFLFWPLAIFSKENGALFPLLVFVIELFFFRNNSNSYQNKLIFKGLFVFLVMISLAVLSVILFEPDKLIAAYKYRDYTLYERLITQPRILLDYVMNLLMIPGGSGMGLFHDDYQKSVSLFSPATTIIAIVCWLLIIVYAVFKAGTKQGFVLFGLVFYLSAHVIESSFIPLELYFEHRNYLPSFGIFLTIGLGLYYVISIARLKKLIVTGMVLILVCYSFFSVYRIDIWRSWSSILLASENQHPDSLRVQRGLVVVFTQRGELNRTLQHLKEVERMDKGRGETGIAMKYLLAYCYAGQYPPEKVYQRLEQPEKMDGDYYTGTVFMWLVESIENRECVNIDLDRLIKIFHSRIDYLGDNLNYNNWVQLVLLARLYAANNDFVQAKKLVNKALLLRPDSNRDVYIKELKQYYESK